MTTVQCAILFAETSKSSSIPISLRKELIKDTVLLHEEKVLLLYFHFQIAYLIAFAFELLWILESSIALPTAAVLLCTAYFSLAMFAAVLIHGLANVSQQFDAILDNQ